MLSTRLSCRSSLALVTAKRSSLPIPLQGSNIAACLFRQRPFERSLHLHSQVDGQGQTRVVLRDQRHRLHPSCTLLSSPRSPSNLYTSSSSTICRSSASFTTQAAQSINNPDSAQEEVQEEEDKEEMDIYTARTILSILDRAKEVWPTPKVPVPPGWSADWDCWDMLLSLYWTSPSYLMLPQIETIFNIYFGIKGETRPIVFSTPDLEINQNAAEEKEGEEEEGTENRAYKAFVFTVVERPDEFYLLEYYDAPALFKISLPDSSSQQQRLTEFLLVELLATPNELSFERIEPSPEGSAALDRILSRDSTVRPELEKFLGYIPEHTESWEEDPQAPYPEESTESTEESDSSVSTEDRQVSKIQRAMKEIEARSPEFREASEAWDKGMLDSSSPLSDQEVDSQSLEDSFNTIGLKDEVAELESMMDNAEGEIKKMDESLQKSASNSDTGSLKVEVDEEDEGHVRLSVPVRDEQKNPKRSK
ncbi:hypothetical protein EV360DRAFT_72097 [Lentinula raphanica]|nr:hypothetical protein EV360DRAFT_72097 [Lentinula raphanica]